MIEIRDLTKTYGQYNAVDHATWTAPDGAITGFIGPNGAGKTTTLKMITGIEKPTSGSILIDGMDITKDPIAVKKSFAYVGDSPDHFLRLKGIEYLNFMADIYDTPAAGRADRIADMAKRFGMSDALKSPILSYSHGMRQKIMVMGALIHDPKVWILDEPMLGLDPQSAFELKQLMREHVAAGNSVLFSTHVLEDLIGQYPEGTSLEEIFLHLTGDAE